jgi:RNA polymerase sigma-70 factor (ECF subfamily)
VDHAAVNQCVRQAQNGDRQAFAELVGIYWPRINRWLFGLTRNTHTAEELTQDVFLRAWSSLGSFQREGGFCAWLFRIAHNRWIDSQRGPRSAPVHRLPVALTSRDAGPVATLLSQETQTMVHEACAHLPALFRAAFLLRTQEKLSFAEIAEVLDLNVETVRWRVFKARQLLLRELGPYLDQKLS